MIIYMILRCAFHRSGVSMSGGVSSASGPIGDFVFATGGDANEKILKFGCLIFCINFVNVMS